MMNSPLPRVSAQRAPAPACMTVHENEQRWTCAPHEIKPQVDNMKRWLESMWCTSTEILLFLKEATSLHATVVKVLFGQFIMSTCTIQCIWGISGTGSCT